MVLDTISAGLSAPTSSALGIAGAALSPTASYEIGQYFKDKGTEGSAAHTVLGAAVAAAGGHDALTAGLIAGGAEASAPVLSQYLYGKKASDLTAEEKSTISAITGLVATGVGGAASGDLATGIQSGQGAQNAVENNFLSDKQIQRKIELIKKANGGKYSAATNSILKAFDTGALTEREAREYLALLAIDNYSDNLIDHYLNNPKNLNAQQLNELKYFLNMASEGNADKVKTIISYAKLNVGDAYPFSSDEMQKAYNKAMYAVSYADSTDYKLAEAGEPALFGLSGGLGTTIRYAGGLYGAYNIGQGSSKIVDGKHSEGVVQVVGGALAIVPLIGQNIVNTINVSPSIMKLGESKFINGVEQIRVGRWMSSSEVAAMQKSGKVVQGGGGQTFISLNGASDFKGATAKGSVYVEFDVPKNSLLTGGKDGWFKMIGPDAGKSQQYLLNKQGGEHLPSVNNIKILEVK